MTGNITGKVSTKVKTSEPSKSPLYIAHMMVAIHFGSCCTCEIWFSTAENHYKCLL